MMYILKRKKVINLPKRQKQYHTKCFTSFYQAFCYWAEIPNQKSTSLWAGSNRQAVRALQAVDLQRGTSPNSLQRSWRRCSEHCLAYFLKVHPPLQRWSVQPLAWSHQVSSTLRAIKTSSKRRALLGQRSCFRRINENADPWTIRTAIGDHSY